jgi:hypothetical protein
MLGVIAIPGRLDAHILSDASAPIRIEPGLLLIVDTVAPKNL